MCVYERKRLIKERDVQRENEANLQIDEIYPLFQPFPPWSDHCCRKRNIVIRSGKTTGTVPLIFFGVGEHHHHHPFLSWKMR